MEKRIYYKEDNSNNYFTVEELNGADVILDAREILYYLSISVMYFEI